MAGAKKTEATEVANAVAERMAHAVGIDDGDIAKLRELEEQANKLAAENLTLAAHGRVMQESNEVLRDEVRRMLEIQPVVPGVAFNTAFARAQGEFRTIGKDREVEVFSQKTGKTYKFNYATLSSMWDVIREPLSRNGFSVMQFPSVTYSPASKEAVAGGWCEVETVLLHCSGESKSWKFMLPFTDRDPKSIGGIVSYAKRYTLGAGLGLASSEETDLDDEGGRFAGMEAPPRVDHFPGVPEVPIHLRSPSPPPASPPVKVKKVSMLDLAMGLQTSATKVELDVAAAAVSAAKERGQITPQQREDLASVYKKRESEIAKGIPDTITGTAAPEPGSEG